MTNPVDLAAYFDSTSRAVRYGAKGTATVSLTLRSTVPDVVMWSALTIGDQIARWLLPVTGQLRQGGHYALAGNASGRILHCVPPREIGITWEYDDDVSWVDVSVSDGAVRLDHRATVNAEHWEVFGPGAVGLGWDLGFLGLARHLAGLDPVADPVLWQGSDEGRRFMHGAASAWAAAAAAAGDDAAEAKLAGVRSAAAYLGESS